MECNIDGKIVSTRPTAKDLGFYQCSICTHPQKFFCQNFEKKPGVECFVQEDYFNRTRGA